MPADDANPTLGIDIGGSSVKVALLDGSVRYSAVGAEYARPDRQTLADAARSAITGLPADRVSGVRRVGLCVPGRIEPSGGSIGLSYNVPGLVGYPFDRIVRDALGTDRAFVVLSDALAGTLDAASAYPNARRVLGIAIGTGVGAAMLENGRPAGETGGFGKTEVGPIGGDASRTLESVVGLTALRERFGGALGERIGALPGTDPALVAISRAIRSGLQAHRPDSVVLLGGIGIALAPNADRLRTLVGVAGDGWMLGFGTSRYHAAFGAARHAGGPG